MEMTANLFTNASGGDWRSTALARAPQVLTIVLALALAAQLALVVVGLSSRSRQAPPAAANAPVAQPLDIGSLVNAHLFGNAAMPATSDAANAPQTSMPLVLAGVLATPDPKQGMAIIGESAGSSDCGSGSGEDDVSNCSPHSAQPTAASSLGQPQYAHFFMAQDNA